MGSSVSHASQARPLLLPEKGAKTAKAGLRSAEKSEIDPHYVKLGGCMADVMRFSGLSLEEFAYALKKDERQIARQLQGKERPQIEAVLAIDRFQGPMVIALARISAGVEVDTVIHVRRTV